MTHVIQKVICCLRGHRYAHETCKDKLYVFCKRCGCRELWNGHVIADRPVGFNPPRPWSDPPPLKEIEK